MTLLHKERLMGVSWDQCDQVKDVILSGAMRSIAKSKDLRTYYTLKVYEMRRSFDSLALAQDDRDPLT